MLYNYFGAVPDDVLGKFSAAGYVPTVEDFGGEDAVLAAMGDAVNQLCQALPLVALEALQHPDLCNVVNRGAQDQTIIPFPAFMLPIVDKSVHVWRGVPSAFTSRPVLNTDAWQGPGPYGLLNYPTPCGPIPELPEDAFTVTSTGVTLASGLARNEQVFATWDVDTESEDYGVLSMANWVADGAASILGSKVYTQATAQWEYVNGLVEGWAALLQSLNTGAVTPADLRAIRWWRAPERAQDNTVGSVRRYRS